MYDAYDVYFRRAAQVKITTPGAYGLVYVADVDTALAAIDAGDTEGDALKAIAGTVDSTDKAIKTKAVSAQ